MTTIKDHLVVATSSAMLAGRDPPPPDTFDLKKLPFGVPAGINKFKLSTCPTCGKPPTILTGSFENFAPSFLFRDTLSCAEYKISGMCQACQDGAFIPDESLAAPVSPPGRWDLGPDEDDSDLE